MDEPSRNDQITDVLITRSLISTDGGGICPDPSVLGALHERLLEPDDARRWVDHLAGCERCQATLAALARSDTDAGPLAQAPAWWRRPWSTPWRNWPVLAPMAGAAVVVLAAWVVTSGPGPSSTVAPRATSPAREAVVRSAPRPQPQREPQTATDTSQFSEETASAVAAEAAASMPTPEVPTVAAADTSPGPASALRAAPAAVVAPTSVEPAPAQDPTSRRLDVRRQTAPSPSTGRALSDAVILRSPEGAIQWRVGPGGEIARTDDGGLNWRVLFTASEPVITGAAPSVNAAWIVGAQGLVLRTTDGEQWARTNPPVIATLTAIEAADDRNATVSTEDGRRFRTSDGGATWTAVP